MKDLLKGQKLLAICLFFCFLFNFPILSLFNKDKYFGFLPTLFFYVFAIWFIMIVVVGLIVEELNKRKSNPETDE
ncbi:MAG: hypothetical protein MUF45_11950 [Spirosomaceae bacterium]|jgi:formate-dependent nitrite reductase membrane component NrfD|nr:hypothetical protein [Spirosomataceae bacterium]